MTLYGLTAEDSYYDGYATKSLEYSRWLYERYLWRGVEYEQKRKQGEGTLQKRADSRWEARIVIGYDDKGLPITKSVTAMEKGKCREKLEQLKEKYCLKTNDSVKTDMPFGDWLDFWYQQYEKQRIRPTTQAHYENLIYNHVVTDVGKIALNKLTQNDLQQFYGRLKTSGTVSNSYSLFYLCLLHNI